MTAPDHIPEAEPILVHHASSGSRVPFHAGFESAGIVVPPRSVVAWRLSSSSGGIRRRLSSTTNRLPVEPFDFFDAGELKIAAGFSRSVKFGVKVRSNPRRIFHIELYSMVINSDGLLLPRLHFREMGCLAGRI